MKLAGHTACILIHSSSPKMCWLLRVLCILFLSYIYWLLCTWTTASLQHKAVRGWSLTYIGSQEYTWQSIKLLAMYAHAASHLLARFRKLIIKHWNVPSFQLLPTGPVNQGSTTFCLLLLLNGTQVTLKIFKLWYKCQFSVFIEFYVWSNLT